MINSPAFITAATALARNRFVVALAERVVIVHAEPGSKTEALLRYAISLGKPTLTFSDNRELLAIGATSLSVGEDRTYIVEQRTPK